MGISRRFMIWTAASYLIHIQAQDCTIPLKNTLTSTCYGRCDGKGTSSCIVFGPEDTKNGCSNQIDKTCYTVGVCIVSCLSQPISGTSTTWTIRVGVPNQQNADVGRVQAIENLDVGSHIKTMRIYPRDSSDKPTGDLIFSPTSFRNAPSLTSIDIERLRVSNFSSISAYPNLTSLRLSNVGLSSASDVDTTNAPIDLDLLDLSLNQLSKLPSFIYNSKKLQHLNMTGNPLVNVHLTSAQLNFLKSSSMTFSATKSIVNQPCQDTYTNTSWNGLSFCVKGGVDGKSPNDGAAIPNEIYTTPVPNPKTSESSSKTSLVFIGMGTCLVLGIIIYLAIFFRKKPKKQMDQQELCRISRTSSAGDGSSLHVMDAGSLTDKKYHPVLSVRLPDSECSTPRDSSTRSTWTMMSFRSMFTEIVYPELSVANSPIVLEHERFDMVLGKYKMKKVFVNRLKPMAHDKAFLFLSLLSTMRHPRLHAVIGVSWRDLDEKTNGIQMDIATENMNCGLLETYLRTNRRVETWGNGKLQLVLDIALGLMYVHEHSFIYDGMTTRSLLVDSSLGCKFHTVALATKLGFPTQNQLHIAPEVLNGESDSTEATDMFAFGVILAQIDAGNGPTWTSRSDIVFSNLCPQVILQVAKSCLDQDPRQRPSASFAYAMIRKEGSFIE